MKLKRRTFKEDIEDVEITLPFYAKAGVTSYNIIDENNILCVSIFEFKKWVSIAVIPMLNLPDGWEEITKEEFETSFNHAKEIIKNYD